MSLTKAIANQSLADISVKNYGTIAGVFELAFANGLSVTDELEAGQTIEVVPFTGVAVDILSFVRKNNIQPATGLSAVPLPVKDEGIGFWAIGINFKVS